MKKIKRTALIIAVLLLIIVAIPSPMHAESLTKHSLSAEAESWYYPVLPGDDEWDAMTIQERYAVCNMPEELLIMCSTERLADLLLDHPLILGFWAYDNTADGLAHLDRMSNIYGEFFSRQEAIDVLIEKFSENEVDYELMKEEQKVNSTSLLVKSGYTKDIFVHAFLGTNYETLSKEQIVKVNAVLEEKYERQKKAYENSFFDNVIYSEVQKSLGTVPFDLLPKTLIEDIVRTDRTVSNLDWGFIPNGISYTKQYPYNYPNDPPGYLRATYNVITCDEGYIYHEGYGISASAPNNDKVYALKYTGDFTSSEVGNLDYYFNQIYCGSGGLSYLASASLKYNCHFYAWVGVSDAQFCCINDASNFYEGNTTYVTYKGVNTSAVSGDIIVMNYASGTPCHSVVVASGGSNNSTIYTIGKMGYFGLYYGTLNAMFGVYSNAANYKVYR